MSGQDSHRVPSSGAPGSIPVRHSKLPLFSRPSSEKFPASSMHPLTFTSAPHGRIRPATVVKPFFASSHQTHHTEEASRRRYSASQPTTPVNPEMHRSSPFYQQGGGSSEILTSTPTLTPGRSDVTHSMRASHAGLSQSGPFKTNGSGKLGKPRRMENLSVEHLLYLERRLQQLLDVLTAHGALSEKAKSDSGRPPMHRGIKQPPHLHHHQPHLVQQPWARSVASFSPYFQGSAAIPPPAPFLLCHSSAPPPTIPHHDSPFGDTDVDPYFLLPPSGLPPARASSCYSASSGLSSTLQDFSPEELVCLLQAVHNMLAMHRQAGRGGQLTSSSSSTGGGASKHHTPVSPLSALQQRPFSWYRHHSSNPPARTPRTAPASPAPSTSSTLNLFLDDDDNEEEEEDEDVAIRQEATRQVREGSGGPSNPPLLPTGFRNFSRYLDGKFGPDESERRRRRSTGGGSSNKKRTSASSKRTTAQEKPPQLQQQQQPSSFSSSSQAPPAPPLPPQQQHQQKTLPPTPAQPHPQTSQSMMIPPYWSAWYLPRYYIPPSPPPPPLPSQPSPSATTMQHQNAAAACWFRAAANHFATAAAIFAADNVVAAAASTQHQLPPMPLVSQGRQATTSTASATGGRGSGSLAVPRRPVAVAQSRTPPAPSPSSLGHYQYRQLHQQPTNAHYPAQRNKSSPQQQAQAPPHHLPPASPHPPLPAAAEDDELFFVVSGSEEEEEEGREEVSQADPGDHLWGVGSDNRRGASTGDVTLTTSDEGGDGLDMLPQDPALILPDQVDFYAQIKDLLELDSNISLPLPAGWAVGISSSGRRFYVSCATTGSGNSSSGSRVSGTRSTTWQHPVIAPRIPLGWERVEMRRGNCVYYRHLLIPHSQRHHPDLWFPTSLKNFEVEQQSWFFDLRKLQESVSNFDKGNSQLIENYVDASDPEDEARFSMVLSRSGLGELGSLLKHMDCRFFRDLHRIVVAFEVARIRIVRQLFVQHVQGASAPSSAE